MKLIPAAAMLGPLLCATVFAASPDHEHLLRECAACHGDKGVSSEPGVPTIAGQPAPLIANAHEQFKDWDRPCTPVARAEQAAEGGTLSMCAVSETLDSTTINAIAAHYAALPFVPAHQPFDTDLAVAGAGLHQMYCESCHPDGGSEAGYAGRLAGQWTPYLRRALHQVAQQEMKVPNIMQHKLSQFSPEDIEALLNFWASQQE